jgi:hypothetical protein
LHSSSGVAVQEEEEEAPIILRNVRNHSPNNPASRLRRFQILNHTNAKASELTVRFLTRTVLLKYVYLSALIPKYVATSSVTVNPVLNRTKLRHTWKCCARQGVKIFAMMHSGSDETSV